MGARIRTRIGMSYPPSKNGHAVRRNQCLLSAKSGHGHELVAPSQGRAASLAVLPLGGRKLNWLRTGFPSRQRKENLRASRGTPRRITANERRVCLMCKSACACKIANIALNVAISALPMRIQAGWNFRKG